MDSYDNKLTPSLGDPDKNHLETAKQGHVQIEDELAEAQNAMHKEHSMPLKLALKAYYPAILWSICLCRLIAAASGDPADFATIVSKCRYVRRAADSLHIQLTLYFEVWRVTIVSARA